MDLDRPAPWWHPRSGFGFPGLKISLILGVLVALILWPLGVGPLWLILILAPVGVFVLSLVAVVVAGTVSGPRPIFHLALRDEWREAQATGGPYTRSTIGVSLEEQGFIHCSSDPEQVQRVADARYRGRDDVVLVMIDRRALTAEVKMENLDGGKERFPHIYGPLNLDAVVYSAPVTRGPDGRLDVVGSLGFELRFRDLLRW